MEATRPEVKERDATMVLSPPPVPSAPAPLPGLPPRSAVRNPPPPSPHPPTISRASPPPPPPAATAQAS
ncbi:MAG TPA: hypothetical protein VGD80_33105, partial [Kofleriaceae bacterium]